MGLNGHNEPIITSLPELLASGISLTAGKPVYLEMDIPPPQVEEPDQKVLPLSEVSTIVIASPHKSTLPKLEGEGSMTREVRDLLSQVILECLATGLKGQLQGGCTTLASRYFVSGKCRHGRSIPRGNPHQHLSL